MRRITGIWLVLAAMAAFCFFLREKAAPFNISAPLLNEVEEQSLSVSGVIPKWLEGTFVRNGPVSVKVNGQAPKHWLDGLAMLHAFTFREGQVTYSNRFLRTDAYRTVFEKGSLRYDGFDSDPCASLFSTFFTKLFPPSSPALPNANVNVTKIADDFVAMTEIPLPVKFGLSSLQTLGALDFQDSLPKRDCWESAHPHGEINQPSLNYLIEYGKTSFYTLYQLEPQSSKRQVLSKIPTEQPAYMHSFAVTEHYVIFTEFPFVVKPLDFITQGKPFIQNFVWRPERGTPFLVVDRQDGSIVGKFPAPPFFAFHHANAYEKDGKLILDIVTYDNPSFILDENLSHESSKLQRFTLSLESGKIEINTLFDKPSEFPRLHPTYDGRPYRFLYLVGFGEEGSLPQEGPVSKGLYKINTETHEVIEWNEEGSSPGEALFVPAPGASREDEGVVLTIVHRTGDDAPSYLLVLDGTTFKEIGRSYAPHAIPPGLHGQFLRYTFNCKFATNIF